LTVLEGEEVPDRELPRELLKELPSELLLMLEVIT
jgi:hypothetical protein